MIDGVLVSNGLCWSPDGARMYAADSPTRTIRTWDYDPETGDIVHERVFAMITDDPGRGTPDGAIVDAAGGLWTAEFRGSRVTRFNPDGTEDLARESLAGALFALDVGVAGLPEAPFSG